MNTKSLYNPKFVVFWLSSSLQLAGLYALIVLLSNGNMPFGVFGAIAAGFLGAVILIGLIDVIVFYVFIRNPEVVRLLRSFNDPHLYSNIFFTSFLIVYILTTPGVHWRIRNDI